jgi:hypothetical protein
MQITRDERRKPEYERSNEKEMLFAEHGDAQLLGDHLCR